MICIYEWIRLLIHYLNWFFKHVHASSEWADELSQATVKWQWVADWCVSWLAVDCLNSMCLCLRCQVDVYVRNERMSQSVRHYLRCGWSGFCFSDWVRVHVSNHIDDGQCSDAALCLLHSAGAPLLPLHTCVSAQPHSTHSLTLLSTLL